MRINSDNCSVINPKTAGSVSLIESIVDDYKSIFTNTETIALDMRYFEICLDNVTEEELIRFLSKLSSVLAEQVSEIIIVGSLCSMKETMGILDRSCFNHLIMLPLNDRTNFSCTNNGENVSIAVCDSDFDFYMDKNAIAEYSLFNKNLSDIWKNIIKIKNELLKYQIFEYSVREKKYELILLFSETEKTFQDILKSEKYIVSCLEGKIKNDSICRFFRSRIKVIETELYLLKSGLDNYFIELDNCL